MKNYLNVVYDYKTRPQTAYPEKLGNYLFDTFEMKPGMKLLEVGCGRGDILKEFKKLGLLVEGVDIAEDAIALNPEINIKICNVEHEVMPYQTNTFDIIYSKSFIEHLYYPEKYMTEAFRLLKPNGLLLTLAPDWEANYKIYFDDYTHRTPFTKYSLEDMYKIFNFNNIHVYTFRQLPIVWKYPVLNYVCASIAPFVPVRTKNKFLRWSRELMLIGAGRK